MESFPITLTRFILKDQASHPAATGEFSTLMVQIGLAGKMIAHDLRRAGLINIHGVTGSTNVQGEIVKKLDELSNAICVNVFHCGGLVCAVASEEMEEPYLFPENWPQGKYMLLFDPLDGSSNTDINMPLGTIFSVLRYTGSERLPAERELVRKGSEQVAAGYTLYGSSTMFVFTIGLGVHGFILDPGIGEYVLSHENMHVPAKGTTYATNEGNLQKWAPGTRRYLEHLKAQDSATGRPYVARYSGCLVGDVHRILLSGGIYLYPGETDKREGKLRLLYEANPLAMLTEQAGGRASAGTGRIGDVEPEALHQRVPLFIGSTDDVCLAEEFTQGRR